MPDFLDAKAKQLKGIVRNEVSEYMNKELVNIEIFLFELIFKNNIA